MSTKLPAPRSWDSPAVREILAKWEAERPAWLAEQRRLDEIEEQRLQKQRAKAAARRDRIRAHKEITAWWQKGVANIMAEVRRREAARALSAPPFFASDNPLDGVRLWA